MQPAIRVSVKHAMVETVIVVNADNCRQQGEELTFTHSHLGGAAPCRGDVTIKVDAKAYRLTLTL